MEGVEEGVIKFSFGSIKSLAVAGGIGAAVIAGSAVAWASTTEEDSAFGQRVKAEVAVCKATAPRSEVGECVSAWVRQNNPGEASEAHRTPPSARPSASPKPSEAPDRDEAAETEADNDAATRPAAVPNPHAAQRSARTASTSQHHSGEHRD